jgi:hypothetical protein
MGTQESEVYMTTQEPHPSEESLRQIHEALEQKPDRDVVEKWLSGVLFKLEKIHEDVRELERDLAYVTNQVDDLYS